MTKTFIDKQGLLKVLNRERRAITVKFVTVENTIEMDCFRRGFLFALGAIPALVHLFK